MSEIFFTSDSHFGHDRGFIYIPRGFSSIEEHDESIIENWNKIIKPDDIVYHLGDFMLGDGASGISALERLNGHIKIILGNHDTDNRIDKYVEYADVIGYADKIKYGKYTFYLSHYKTESSNLNESNLKRVVLNLHGHTHSKNRFENDNPYQYHVGLDAHCGNPVHIEEIIADINGKYEECKSYM